MPCPQPPPPGPGAMHPTHDESTTVPRLAHTSRAPRRDLLGRPTADGTYSIGSHLSNHKKTKPETQPHTPGRWVHSTVDGAMPVAHDACRRRSEGSQEPPAATSMAKRPSPAHCSVRPLASEGDHLHGPLGFVHRVLAWPVHHELQQRAHRGELLVRVRARVGVRAAARPP